ncbi:MAG: hypothetical protein V1776_03235 [Candidatus Diapherotrites archaeon]
MAPNEIRRRRKGFVRRSRLIDEVRPRKTNPLERVDEINHQFHHVQKNLTKWLDMEKQCETEFAFYVQSHSMRSPEMKRQAARLMRRLLIADKRRYPIFRKWAILQVYHTVYTTFPSPNEEERVWGKIAKILKSYEEREAMVDRLLHNPALFEDYVNGCISRAKGW